MNPSIFIVFLVYAIPIAVIFAIGMVYRHYRPAAPSKPYEPRKNPWFWVMAILCAGVVLASITLLVGALV